MGTQESSPKSKLSEQGINLIFENQLRVNLEKPNVFEGYADRLIVGRKSKVIRVFPIVCDQNSDTHASPSEEQREEEKDTEDALPSSAQKTEDEDPEAEKIHKSSSQSEFGKQINDEEQQEEEEEQPKKGISDKFKKNKNQINEASEKNSVETPKAPRAKRGKDKNEQVAFAAPEKIYSVKEQYANGSVYEGSKVNQHKQGFGIFYFMGGACYKGMWEKDKMIGKGMFYSSNGQLLYLGHFQDNLYQGFGYLTNQIVDYSLPPGDQEYYLDFDYLGNRWINFEGSFSKNQKDGDGRLYFSNGDIFHGLFENNKANGQGFIYNSLTKQIIKGVWKDNKMQKEE